MMGFPDDFILSESNSQAMKQLGNSVCVDVVYNVAKEVIRYMKKDIDKVNSVSFNKGEWSELYAFFKIIFD